VLLTNKLISNNHLSIIIYNYILTTINYYKLLSSISQKSNKIDNLIIIINQLISWWINNYIKY